jgi:acyl-CoA reductase-like NAD-dependent aldehyde dehydrogenase
MAAQFVNSLKLGNPADPSVVIGPVIREEFGTDTSNENVIGGKARHAIGTFRETDRRAV